MRIGGKNLIVLVCFGAVTAVDSGRRALQFLGLDENESSVGLDVSVENI